MAIISNSSLDGLDKAKRAIDLIEDSLIKASAAQKKLVKNLDLTTAKGHKALNAELKTAALREKELIKIENEKVKLLRTEEQLLQAKKRTLVQTRKEEERQIQITKRLKRETEKLTSRYQQETALLNRLRKRFKDLALTEGTATSKTRRLATQIKKLDIRLKSVDASVGQFTRKVGDYQGALTGSLGAVGQFATGAGAIAGAVLIAGSAIRSAVNIIKDFEQANANLQAVLGGTREEMQPLIVQAKALGASTAFSATEVTGLNTELAKLGFPIEDIQQMSASTLDAATAMGSDLAAQAALTGATLKAFGLDASQTKRVNDVLAEATRSSALDFEKLNSSMSTIAPVAKAFGFSLEGSVALLGELSNAGFDASSAATATRNIILNLADSNSKLSKSLKEPVKDLPSLVKGLKQLKEEGVDLGEALELTDKRSVAAFSTFLEGADSVLELNKTLEDVQDTAAEMAAIQLATLEGSIKILNSSWEGLILSMEDGSGVMNTIATEVVKDLATALSIISGESKEAKKEFSALGTVLTVIKTSFTVLIGAVRIFLTPLRLMIDGIVFLGEKIANSVKQFLFFNKAIGSTGSLLTLITQIFNNLPEIVDIVVDRVIKSLTRLVKFDFKGALSEITGIGDDIKELLSDIEKGEKGIGERIKATTKLISETQESLKKLQEQRDKSNDKEDIAFLNERINSRQTELTLLAKLLKKLKQLQKEKPPTPPPPDDDADKDAKRLTGLINEQREAIRKLQEQRDKSDDAQEIAFLNDKIKARQEELKLLTDSLIKIEKIQKREAEIAEDGIKIQKAKGKTTEEILKAEADAEAERIKKQKEQIRELAKALDKGAEAQRKAHQERLSQFDEEIAASKKLQDSLAEDARRGVADAEDNLVFARQKEREATLERIQEVERQKRVEEGLVFLKLLANNAGNPNVKQPVLTSIAQFTAARLFISSLAGFYEGTDNVAKSLGAPALPGKDGHIIRVDGSEQIWSGRDVAEMNNKSREEIKDLAHLGEQYKLGRLNDVSKKHKELHIASSYMSNDRIIGKMDELIESNNNAYKKVKTTQITAGDIMDIAREVIREEGKTIINVYKKDGIF